ncbi:Hypothetical protein CM240_1007 [Clostridium bornimense]|uniref:DUF3793 domain-containing protein n=1 Tax=Clostridium bornimense TaxID=1216932 RepID=W6RU77_9CLOT|nr:DUF3793 family protein [Clostridium bornimense]CDM68171.1 Hypothetical protein CM240_1007 [Clostridium bornimense]
MEYIEFLKKLTLMSRKEYIEYLLLYKTCLVISEVKPAVTIAFSKIKNNQYEDWCKFGINFLDTVSLDYMVLRDKEDIIILMIYNKKLLEEVINEKENKSFLKEFGYYSINLESNLKILKNRYDKYNCPHEIGIFLGIPVEEVRAFIISTDNNYIESRYWKVFVDRKKSTDIFKRYDFIRKYTISSIINGFSLYKVVSLIKENLY